MWRLPALLSRATAAGEDAGEEAGEEAGRKGNGNILTYAGQSKSKMSAMLAPTTNQPPSCCTIVPFGRREEIR